MKSNKLLESIMILDTLERKRFRNVIKNKKRETLASLYELCITQIEKGLPLPEKEVVYSALFNKKYKKADDFLLRNEYRLLTDEVEAFLRHNAVEDQFPGICEAARLKRIFASGNSSLFKKEFDASKIKFKNDLMFWFGIDPVYLYYYITTEQMSIEHFETVKNLIDNSRDRLTRLYNRFLADYEVKRGYADKVQSILTDIEIVDIKSATLPTKVDDDLVNYRKLKARTYYTSGTEKIQILLDANAILNKKTIPEFGIDENWWLKASAGLEYYLQYDFKNAIVYFDELFASPGIEKFNRLAEAALNYLSALMSVADYEKAVSVIIPFEERMAASPPVFYKYICLKSVALLFLNNPHAARKELNRLDKQPIDYDFFYWRITMVLTFAVEKRWDDAQNEFKNLQKTKTIKHNVRQELDNLIIVLDYLIKFAIAEESGKKISAKAWSECDNKIKGMINNPGDFLHPPRLIKKLLEELKNRH